MQAAWLTSFSLMRCRLVRCNAISYIRLLLDDSMLKAHQHRIGLEASNSWLWARHRRHWTFSFTMYIIRRFASSFETGCNEGLGKMWKQRQFESICATPTVSFRHWSAYIRWMPWHSVSNIWLHQELSETVVTPCHLFICLHHQSIAITIPSYWPHQWRQFAN